MSEWDNAPEYGDLFNRLERETAWDLSGVVETSGASLLSMDDDCRTLSRVFQEHCIAFEVDSIDGPEKFTALERIAQLLEREFANLQDLQIDTLLQTRGEGLCMTFNSSGHPDDIQFITDETRLRGELLGVHCLPVPTEYALIAGISDDPHEYVPTLCLMLQATNLTEFEDIVTQDGIIALPLRMEGFGVDRVIRHGE